MKASAFRALLQRLAQAWSEQDTETAVACFTDDAVYMEPPAAQLYVGEDQLRLYFGALQPGTYMRWQGLWFDEKSQTGVGEFSFGRAGRDVANHGVAVVRLRSGRIFEWREYQSTGPAAFEEFKAIDGGKAWTWTIQNYP